MTETTTTATTPPTAPTDQEIHRIFTALLVLGVSGAGKTSLLATFADYLWETYKKILLLYSWDGGAIPTDIQKRIHQGLIRFWRVRTRSADGLALEALYFATKGYWPRQINPQTGETTPAVDLVAPVTTRYALHTKDGRLLKIVPSASLIKPTHDPQTNTMIQPAEMIVREEVARTKGFEQVGGVAFDGLTSMADVVMNNQDYLRGHGLIGGEKSSFGGVVSSGSRKWGGNNRADVGFAQTRASEFVSNSLSIPYLVESPVFTGLSTEGTDKGGLSIIGVDLPGQAALTQAPQWFGNIVEAAKIKDDAGRERYALFLQPHTDDNGRRHLLKSAASPWGVPDVLIDPAKGEGKPFSEFNLGKVFRLLDEDLRKSLAEAVEGAPGMPAGLMEVGEATTVEVPETSAGTPPTTPSPVSPAKPAGPQPARAPAARRPPPAAGGPGQMVAPPSNAAAPTAPLTNTAPPPPGRPPARAPQPPVKPS